MNTKRRGRPRNPFAKRRSRYTWSEYLENKHQLCARGAALPHAKFDEAKVRAIRARYVPFCPVNGAAAMARDFGVRPASIQNVITRATWAHVR